MREPKKVKKEEYEEFYKATSKDSVAPLTWSHFKCVGIFLPLSAIILTCPFVFCVRPRADSGAGISFRALIFVPSELPQDFWGKAEKGIKGIVRLMVKRVFITDDLGEGYIPRWLSFLKIHVDGQSIFFPPFALFSDTETDAHLLDLHPTADDLP